MDPWQREIHWWRLVFGNPFLNEVVSLNKKEYPDVCRTCLTSEGGDYGLTAT